MLPEEVPTAAVGKHRGHYLADHRLRAFLMDYFPGAFGGLSLACV